MKNAIPFRVHPMLATLVRKPFQQAGWVYEEKYDGFRILAYKQGTRVRLISRNDIDRTEHFAEVARAIARLRPANLLLDGEVVVFDRKGVSHFQLLQQGQGRFTYAVFDCLYLDGKDLRRVPLAERRAALESALGGTAGNADALRLSRRLSADGLAAYRIARREGYEGLIAKDAASPYVEGRSRFWLKVKVHQEDEFIIAGFTQPAGTRKYFGALLLGAYDRGKLVYVGKVGTGFDENALASLYAEFRPLIRPRSDLVNAPRAKNVAFLAPRLVAQIAYREWTADHKLRQPVYLGLREDKSPAEVVLPGQ